MSNRTYHNVTIEEIQALLQPQGFVRVDVSKFDPTNRTREIVFGKRVDQDGHILTLRVYTGIEPDGNSRGVGEDAMRVALWMRRSSDGKPTELGGSKRVNRIQTWEKNLQERLNNWLDHMPKESCPECGSPLVVKQNRKRKSSFLGCSNYPNCSYTRNCEKG